MNIQRQSGFTLYELMITLVVVSILLSVGIPNLMEFRKNSEMASLANDLLSAFVLARSEAPRTKTNVTICPTKDPLEAIPICEDHNDWETGWVVFIDADGDIEVDDPATEPVLRRYPAIPEDYEIEIEGNNDFFSFGPNGLGRTDVDTSKVFSGMTVCDDRGNVVGAGGWSTARRLVVSPMGRATIIRDVARISAAGGCP